MSRSSSAKRGAQRRQQSFPPKPQPLRVPVPDSHTHLDITVAELPPAEQPPAEPAPAQPAAGQPATTATPGQPADTVVLRTVADALDLAASVGVDRVVQIGVDVASSAWGVEIAETDQRVVATVALHPNEAPRLGDLGHGHLDEALRQIERMASAERVRAIGETGLDYFRTAPDGQAAQHDSFRAHIDIAKRFGKPLVIHDREAHADVLRLLDECGAPDTVVMHCFSGDAQLAAECVRRGYNLSFAGNVTFASATALREAVRATPLELLLVETDAPFLTPVPYRGRLNASYLIPLTLAAIAAELGVDLDECAAAIATNTERVFGSWASPVRSATVR